MEPFIWNLSTKDQVICLHEYTCIKSVSWSRWFFGTADSFHHVGVHCKNNLHNNIGPSPRSQQSSFLCNISHSKYVNILIPTPSSLGLTERSVCTLMILFPIISFIKCLAPDTLVNGKQNFSSRDLVHDNAGWFCWICHHKIWNNLLQVTIICLIHCSQRWIAKSIWLDKQDHLLAGHGSTVAAILSRLKLVELVTIKFTDKMDFIVIAVALGEHKM